MNLWANIKNRGLKDILNPKRWGMFLRSVSTPEKDAREFQAYVEQIIYRQSFYECKKCLKNGSCTHCGCSTPDLFFEKEMVCSGGNWNEILPADEWEEFKKDSGIEIKAVYVRN